MTKVAERIIGNAGGDLGSGVSAAASGAFGREDEVGELVFQFGAMIRGLGGSSSASTVAKQKAAKQEDNSEYVRGRPFSAMLVGGSSSGRGGMFGGGPKR